MWQQNPKPMKILYNIYQICIAYIIGADNSHRTGHYYRFVIGRRPHLGILSGENMVTIDLLSSTYSGKNKRAGEIA